MGYQKIAEATSNLISNKIADKLQKKCNRIIKKQLQMNMIKKYQKKDIYLPKKDKNLLII